MSLNKHSAPRVGLSASSTQPHFFTYLCHCQFHLDSVFSSQSFCTQSPSKGSQEFLCPSGVLQDPNHMALVTMRFTTQDKRVVLWLKEQQWTVWGEGWHRTPCCIRLTRVVLDHAQGMMPSCQPTVNSLGIWEPWCLGLGATWLCLLWITTWISNQ